MLSAPLAPVGVAVQPPQAAGLPVAVNVEDTAADVCAAPPVLHHVYVRAEFRGQGVAKKLFAALSGPCERASLPFRGARQGAA